MHEIELKAKNKERALIHILGLIQRQKCLADKYVEQEVHQPQLDLIQTTNR